MPTIKTGGLNSKYEIVNNSLYTTKLDYEPRKIEYEIGDTKEGEFYPQFKTMHWGNECNFSMRYVSPRYDMATLINLPEGISWIDGDTTIRMYEVPGYEDGGFEFEIELAAKPASNVFEFTLKTKGFKFLYQNELTPEEIAEGTIRPDNVVGSYAVYHATKSHNLVGGMEYRAGKAFHIFRPFAEDANNNTVWCDLNISGGMMTVTVPQGYLDSAVYPVIIDPLFGYDTIGGTTNTGTTSGATPVSGAFTLSEAGIIEKMTKYDGVITTTSGFIPCIFDDVAGTPTNLMGQGDQTDLTSADQWNDLPVSSEFALAPADYWMGYMYEDTHSYWWDAQADALFEARETWPTIEDPYVVFSGPNARKVSFYATYRVVATITGVSTITGISTITF